MVHFNVVLRAVVFWVISSPRDFRQKCDMHFSSPHVCATCPFHLILDLIILSLFISLRCIYFQGRSQTHSICMFTLSCIMH
jgi:hypothetical protein